MMRCGPWVYDSNLTGKINEYEYKCNNLSANAINLTSSFITAASVMYSLSWEIEKYMSKALIIFYNASEK